VYNIFSVSDEKADISLDEKNTLAKVVKELVQYWNLGK
jgi:hypothetical protein